MMAALLLVSSILGCAKSAGPGPSPADAGVAELRPPTGDYFIFGPGDVISVDVWRQADMSMELTVTPDGNVSYPLVGKLRVAGLNVPQTTEAFETALSEYYTEPHVSVNIVQVSNQKVLVLGEVKNPAVLQIEGEMSILEALTRTGGLSYDARTDNVLLIRGGIETPELYLVDVSSIYGQGDMSQLVWLMRGDIVYVPTRTIANVERFFGRIQGMLAPFVAGSAVYRNAISGGAQGTSVIVQ